MDDLQMKSILKQIGERICIRRSELGITQENLAERTGLNTKHISVIENGNRTMMIDTMMKICTALDLDYTYLITGNNTLAHQDDILYKLSHLTPDQSNVLMQLLDVLYLKK